MKHYNNWRNNDQGTTYKSQGVHKNRDATAKMAVDPIDRQGISDSTKAANEKAMREAAAATVEQTAGKIAPNEPVITRRNKDTTQELHKQAGKATQAAAARVDAGQYLPPLPGSGTQASYGDGAPSGGGGSSVNVNVSYEGGGEGGGQGGGGMSMGGDMQSAGAAQLGKDIAAMDDTIDQATEALFQDDTDIETMQAIAEAEQGR